MSGLRFLSGDRGCQSFPGQEGMDHGRQQPWRIRSQASESHQNSGPDDHCQSQHAPCLAGHHNRPRFDLPLGLPAASSPRLVMARHLCGLEPSAAFEEPALDRTQPRHPRHHGRGAAGHAASPIPQAVQRERGPDRLGRRCRHGRFGLGIVETILAW